jgi:hypothetical protein
MIEGANDGDVLKESEAWIRIAWPGQFHPRVSGSVIENVAPRSGLFAAHILPP